MPFCCGGLLVRSNGAAGVGALAGVLNGLLGFQGSVVLPIRDDDCDRSQICK